MRGPSGCLGLVAVGLMMGCQGCIDALSEPNPDNCMSSGIPCAEGLTCSAQTQRCVPVAPTPDCTLVPAMCSASDVCDSGLKRCLPQRFALGQPDDSDNLNTRYGMYQPIAAKLVRDQASGHTRLVVADGINARTLIWNDVPSAYRPPDAVLGQPDLQTIQQEHPFDPNPSSMSRPYSIASDGRRLLVSDVDYHRVMIWNQLPTQSGGNTALPASTIWGQPDAMSGLSNAGSMVLTGLGVNHPLIFAETSPQSGFYVSDYENRRILVFAGIPSTNQRAPQWVIGQPDLATANLGSGPADLGGPCGLYSDGSQLFVADLDRSRVLVYNLPLTGNQPTPDGVIAQADLVSTKYNRGGGVGPDTLAAPTDVEITLSGGQRLLWVADSLNHRIVRYTLPSTTADLVLGQSDFTSRNENRGGPVSAASLLFPQTVSSDGTHLVIADFGNNRVLLWNSLPTSNGQPADVVVGQPSATLSAMNMPPTIHGLQFSGPRSVSHDGQRLLVTDSQNHRVLIWNQSPKEGVTPPDLVLGQSDFYHFSVNSRPTQRTFNAPYATHSDGTRLAVADSGNNRVLIWNQIPTQSFAAADVVLGQLDMTSNAYNVSATAMHSPQCVHFAQGALFVCDSYNNRVLRFDPPYVTGAAARRVLGQPDMMTNNSSAGGLSAKTLAEPTSIASDGQKLLVADHGSARVLVWNSEPGADFQPADVVIGAPDFDRVDADPALPAPFGVATQGGKLFVGSTEKNRVLYWNHIPTQNGVAADGVLGQPDLQSTAPNNHALPPIDRLSGPAGLALAGDRLFIADLFHNRVISRELPP